MASLDTTPPLSLEDVVAAAAPAGKRALLLGCGDGELGAALLAKGAAEVVGLDACARGLTRSRLTAVYRVEPDAAPELPYPAGYFDLLVVEDLSALVVAGATLGHFRRWLSDEGLLVAVAPNGNHEAALVALLATGHWPTGAGRRPITFEWALAALEAGGFTAQEELLAVRTEAGPTVDILRQLAEALGAPAGRIADSLTLVRSILSARPTERRGARAVGHSDPWAGSRPVKVLLTPRLDEGTEAWIPALAGLAQGLSGNPGVTMGVALPLPLLQAPPAALGAALAGLEIDLLLTEAPSDPAGWERLLAGASTWVDTSNREELLPLARAVGVDVQQAG